MCVQIEEKLYEQIRRFVSLAQNAKKSRRPELDITFWGREKFRASRQQKNKSRNCIFRRYWSTLKKNYWTTQFVWKAGKHLCRIVLSFKERISDFQDRQNRIHKSHKFSSGKSISFKPYEFPNLYPCTTVLSGTWNSYLALDSWVLFAIIFL